MSLDVRSLADNPVDAGGGANLPRPATDRASRVCSTRHRPHGARRSWRPASSEPRTELKTAVPRPQTRRLKCCDPLDVSFVVPAALVTASAEPDRLADARRIRRSHARADDRMFVSAAWSALTRRSSGRSQPTRGLSPTRRTCDQHVHSGVDSRGLAGEVCHAAHQGPALEVETSWCDSRQAKGRCAVRELAPEPERPPVQVQRRARAGSLRLDRQSCRPAGRRQGATQDRPHPALTRGQLGSGY
jgi:hypothetical protein